MAVDGQAKDLDGLIIKKKSESQILNVARNFKELFNALVFFKNQF